MGWPRGRTSSMELAVYSWVYNNILYFMLFTSLKITVLYCILSYSLL